VHLLVDDFAARAVDYGGQLFAVGKSLHAVFIPVSPNLPFRQVRKASSYATMQLKLKNLSECNEYNEFGT
jgi:hypothetical protein